MTCFAANVTRFGRRWFVLVLLSALWGPVTSANAEDAPRGGSSTIASLEKYLRQPRAKRPALDRLDFATKRLSRAEAEAANKLLWLDQVEWIRASRIQELREKIVRDGALSMPYYYQVFGKKPAGGRSLFISMHGGGNAPPALNDQQWENQKHLYRPAEGVYLAPRTPTNTWNMWHEPHIDRMFGRLIEDLIVLEDVNPNRVYIMGYSAGGDGVYQLAPRMADRLAAAAMMAGHPNDASPLGLRNVAFAIHVGALDSGYNRNKVAAEWGRKLDELRKADPQGYVHLVKLHAGKSHWMNREDAEAVPWMAGFTREPSPTRVVWRQSGTTHDRFYWLAVDSNQAKAGREVVVQRNGQKITIEKCDVSGLRIRLNDSMLDLDKPVVISSKTKVLYQGTPRRTVRTLATTLAERGDPSTMYTAEVDLAVTEN